MRSLALCVAATVLACSGASGPPAGPKHDPANSPEAASSCPEKWRLAKEARELLLGDESIVAKQRAASAVLSQADCEVAVLESGAFRRGAHADILAQVKDATAAHRDTTNLYNEVEKYSVPVLAIAAMVGRGRLHRVFAARLDASPMPSDITVLGEQSAYRDEIAALVGHFVGEAERELRAAISAGQSQPGAAAHVQKACAELGLMKRNEVDGC